MLISCVEEKGGTMGEGQDVANEAADHAHDFQTANELFELMAKNNNFKPNEEDDSLSTRDLVLLYKNIDLGTKLMSNANEFKMKTPNQYVETVVYNEDAESDSDISEIYNSEDLHNVVLINKERIDLFNNPPSLENTLCQKLGDLEIKTSDMSNEYNRKFLFKDPYIKEQLKSLNLMSSSSGFEGTLLPASLLDYICYKRLEDNYTFYMDNIIKYVKHTIEQLKRISNGDYLTEKAKEKWREVENDAKNYKREVNNTTVLETSTSIPLHVERKITGHVTTWDDIVHSEVDIRSLSKILEKKIVFEIPKLICGSYRIFSKCYADNLVVSCKKEIKTVLAESKKEESRVDVVFELARSESGHVMSNISSIMILQKASEQQGQYFSEVLPIAYNEIENQNITRENEFKIVELDNRDNNNSCELNIENNNETTATSKENDFDSDIESTELDDIESSSINAAYQDSSASSRDIRCNKRKNRAEAAFDLIPHDELRLTIQRLNMQSSLPEESIEDTSSVNALSKKKSPTRNRIRSPYENKSFIMEEKKRKRLLEIRQRREKSKIAMTEKVSKHKYGKGTIMPQTSNSVTKLSITNKSFYNSIYGHSGTVNADHKQAKYKFRKDKKDASSEMSSGTREDDDVDSIKTPVIRSQKFINRSYYLDDTLTEMMYLQMKKKNGGKETFSESTSAVSTDFTTNLKILSQLIAPSASEINVCDNSVSPRVKYQGLDDVLKNMETSNSNRRSLASSQSSRNLVLVNTPKVIDKVHCDIVDPKKSTTSVEFRKSIDKIYDLMNKIGKTDETENKQAKSKFTAAVSETFNAIEDRVSSTVQGSDSGTSIKHRLTSSNPSCFSFAKVTNSDLLKIKTSNPKKSGIQSAVVPKVIISTKFQTTKANGEKSKQERKKSAGSPRPKVIRDNPLKAISQLLHEFDYVQKTRFKQPGPKSSRTPKKSEASDGRTTSRQVSQRKTSRLEHHVKDNEPHPENFSNLLPIKEKRPKLMHPTELPRLPQTQITGKRLVADVTDEVKESRGEAVRGPSKLNSRLNSLAQPKRTYVQAHIEEVQTKYGRSQMSDRLQKLAGGLHSQNPESNSGSPKHKHRRNGADMSTMPFKQPQPLVPPSEKPMKLRPLSSSSVEAKMRPLLTETSYKQSTSSDTPDNIKKKMVAVESYVKNHYGHGSLTENPNELLRGGQKSRAPLLPNDLELMSLTSSPTAEESTAIGSRLHHIIDTMMIPSPPPLTILPECYETNSKGSENEFVGISLADNLSKEEISPYETFDCHHDEFQDNQISLSGVENVNNGKGEEKVASKLFGDTKLQTYVQLAMDSYSSSNEMQKLENALYRRISVGTFQKRLRIKNLTLTPKQSMQQVLLLQSGDAGPVVLKSIISQEMKLSKSQSETKDLNTLTGLSDSPLGWGFANFPIQITTVGYAFPESQPLPCCSKSKAMSLEANDANDKLLNKTPRRKCRSARIDKTSQCFKGRQNASHSGEENHTAFKAFIDSIKISRDSVPDQKSEKIESKEIQTSKINNDIRDCKTIAKSVGDKTKTFEEIKVNDRKEETPAIKKDINVDYTTSLDILAGLLNEIQKITTCQTQMVNSDSDHYVNNDRKRGLEMILNEAAALESSIKNNPRQIISISSLDKLRQLESNTSIYSLYVSNDGDEGKIVISEPTAVDVKDTNIISDTGTVDVIIETSESTEQIKNAFKPVCADKQVAVELPVRELVNNFTDTPSRLSPITVNNGTTISNSMIGVLSQPSSQSMLSFTENIPLHYNKQYLSNKKIIELSNDATDLKETSVKELQCLEESEPILFKEEKKIHLNFNKNYVDNKIINTSIRKAVNMKKINQLSCTKTIMIDKHYVNSGSDPVIKMKRDILVTVYSILVFTVFAALSFPEFMYHHV